MVNYDGVNWDQGCLNLESALFKTYANHIYTVTIRITDNLHTLTKWGTGSLTGNTYFSDFRINVLGIVVKQVTSNQSGSGFLIFVKGGDNVPFDFTISDLALYEGAYINPPNIESPDVLYADVLHTKNEYYSPRPVYNSRFKIYGKSAWTRILRIRNMFTKSNSNWVIPWTSWYGKFLLIKGYSQPGSNSNNNTYSLYTFEIMGSLGGSGMNKNYIVFNVNTDVPNNGQPLNLWRITIDPEKSVYGAYDGFVECQGHSQMNDTGNTCMVFVMTSSFGYQSDSSFQIIEHTFTPDKSPASSLLVGTTVAPTSLTTIVSGSASVVL